MSSLRFVALLVAATSVAVLAKPNLLECGTDATSRLQVGQTIMGHPVANAADAAVKVAVNADKVTITTPFGTYFTARAFGPGAELALNSPEFFLGATKGCNQQIYTKAPNFRSTYTFSQKNATSIVVGYAQEKGTVSLVTTTLEVSPL